MINLEDWIIRVEEKDAFSLLLALDNSRMLTFLDTCCALRQLNKHFQERHGLENLCVNSPFLSSILMGEERTLNKQLYI